MNKASFTEPGKTSDVFLSYKREDEPQVRKIYDDLKLRGVTSVWMDRHALEPGDKWKKVITEAIEKCSHLVVFVSPLALKSTEVQYEYELAHQRDKVIIPVILYTSRFEDLPSILQESNGLDMTRDGFDKTIIQLAKKLPRWPYLLPTMQPIAGGPFIMGGPNEQQKLNLPSFWIAKTAITVTEYIRFIEAGGYENKDYWIGDKLEKWRRGPRESTWPHRHLREYALEHPLQPMRGLTWYEALAYCRWLSYVASHPFELPTEAQWEKAARGVDGRKWAVGNNWLPSVADIKEGSTARLDPKNCGIIGSESPFGCQDMVGQVWNWTLSVDLPLSYHDSKQAENLDDLDAPRIIRGGSWMHGPAKALTYHRESQMPIPEDYRYEIGFRVATNEDPSIIFMTVT